jgi:serine/threonine protein kinase
MSLVEVTWERRPKPVPIGVGSTLGAYRLLERLGSGGMGEVFLALHEKLERRVALKILHAERAGTAHHVDRFVREAWMANRIRHENVVDVTDLQFLPDGRPYVVMEYIDGGTLYTLWDEQPGMDLLRFMDVMIQVAAAMAAAHRASIVHRDIKPANIFLLERDGRHDLVKIADFGLSKLMTSTADHFTQSGIILATPPYMSPEQATGEPIDGRSDIYSFGVTMWEMLVGRRPFRCSAFGEYVLMHATRAIEPPSLAGQSMVPGGIPAILDEIVLRCLGKKPQERYASAEELRAALGEARDQLAGKTSGEQLGVRARKRIRAAGLVAAALFVVSLPILGAQYGARSARSEQATASAAGARASTAAPFAKAAAPARSPASASSSASAPTLREEPAAARPVKMEGLGLTISRPAPPRKHRDNIDKRALKDPFAKGGD